MRFLHGLASQSHISHSALSYPQLTFPLAPHSTLCVYSDRLGSARAALLQCEAEVSYKTRLLAVKLQGATQQLEKVC